MKRLLLMIVVASGLALAGSPAIYPGSKPVPLPATPDKSAEMYVSADSYEKVVAFYTRLGKVEQTVDVGGRRTFLALDPGLEIIVWEVKPQVTSITVRRK